MSASLAPTSKSHPGSLPFWCVNVPPEEWPLECPDYLRTLSEKDQNILATPDADFRRLSWEEVKEVIGRYFDCIGIASDSPFILVCVDLGGTATRISLPLYHFTYEPCQKYWPCLCIGCSKLQMPSSSACRMIKWRQDEMALVTGASRSRTAADNRQTATALTSFDACPPIYAATASMSSC